MKTSLPRLIALAGPLRGATCELNAREFYIGRDQSNQLYINDHLVSRLHALIVRKDDRFEISDLKSANGTMVNGVPVKQRRLEHCDQIAIGNSLLLFLLHEEETASATSVALLDNGKTAIGMSTLLLQEDALYLHVEKVLKVLPHSERIARDLAALLKISVSINSIRHTKPLLRTLLELIFEFIPAQQGVILLVDESQCDKVEVDHGLSVSFDRELGLDQQIQVSDTVVQQVLQAQGTLLSDNVLESDTLSPTPSLLASKVHSLLVSTLVISGKNIGVIHLTSHDQALRFNKDHQELLTAIASIAAATLENTLRAERLHDEFQRQRNEMSEMIGESKPMRQLGRLITKVAASKSTVLIRGESGAGKELVARAIHRQSPHAREPFVPVNCAAIRAELFESELFGHERGAFTGAINQKRGLLEVADKGTIFLDEVGGLPLALQAKLLRAIQEKEIMRVGGTRPIKVNVRVIAATNRDLEAMVKDGRFREDLYHRLNVVSVTPPPLRERREDILLLAGYFLIKFGAECNRFALGFSLEAKQCLMHYEWPGNVRELANAVEYAVALGEGEFIRPFDLPEAVREAGISADASDLNLSKSLKETKKQLILQATEHARGNLTSAAKLLGVDPSNLLRLIRDLTLKPEIDRLIQRLKTKPESEK